MLYGGLPEVVRKIQAFAADRSLPCLLPQTSAYCQATPRNLDITDLQAFFRIPPSNSIAVQQVQHPIGRRVVVVDGVLGLAFADTVLKPAAVWPQLAVQKPDADCPQGAA